MHSATVLLEFGKLNNAIKWCIDHSVNNWYYSITSVGGKNPGEYTFTFQDIKDCTIFKLKFS